MWKVKNLSCLLLTFFFIGTAFGEGASDYQVNEVDQELLDSFQGLFHLPQAHPGRYALNEIATRHSWRAFNLLKGKWLGTEEEREDARKHLKALKAKIELGQKWPINKPPHFDIPKADSSPVIDGYLNDPSWKKALTFQGLYEFNSTDKITDDSVWKMMWDDNYLYVGVSFSDKYIQGHNTPYLGDCVEVFIMPSLKMRKYWEVIVGCEGNIFDGLHRTHKWGGFSPGAEENIDGLKTKVNVSEDKFCVEIAMPFTQIPNYMLGNKPKPGETIFFAMVRMNKIKPDAKVIAYSPFPLLYGGHNIFGYAKGKFVK